MPTDDAKGMLVRGLKILEVVAKAEPGTATVAAVAEQIGLPKSTVYRLVSTERELGYLSYDETTRSLSLGMKIFELAATHSLSRDLPRIAKPIMEELSQETGETVQLSVLSGTVALFVEKVSSRRHAITISGNIGDGEPLYATSTGKVLLAYQSEKHRQEVIERIEFVQWTPNTIMSVDDLVPELERVRERGYALANEEFDAGVVAIGVPVFNSLQNVMAALCVSAPRFRTDIDTLLGWLPRVQDSARRIGLMLIR